MAGKDEDHSSKSLSAIFKEGLDLFNNLGSIDEPTNSSNVQLNVKRAMHLLEDATRLVSIADIFSKNESIEEVATEHIQYLLLPALLGSLCLKLTSGERKDIISAAEVYFKDFLERCNNYGMSNYKFKENVAVDSVGTELEQISQSVNTRASKIQRFKEQKELKEKLEVLRNNLNNDHVDEEIKRNYYLTLIKLYIYESIDELSSIDMEKPILEHMEKLGPDRPKPKRPMKPLKPIIIAKDEIQKAVFGAGYPSLPTMTVQEFYEKRVKDGIFPDPTKPKKPSQMSLQEQTLAGISLNSEEEEDVKQEEMVESDDPENLARLRAKDEFKDDHRRGWGNRMNRS